MYTEGDEWFHSAVPGFGNEEVRRLLKKRSLDGDLDRLEGVRVFVAAGAEIWCVVSFPLKVGIRSWSFEDARRSACKIV